MILRRFNPIRSTLLAVLCGTAVITMIPECIAAPLATIRGEAGNHDRVDTSFPVELADFNVPPDSTSGSAPSKKGYRIPMRNRMPRKLSMTKNCHRG